MHEVYSMLKQKGLKLILINEEHADGITLDHVKTLLEGTKAVAQIKALEENPLHQIVQVCDRTDLQILQQTDQLARHLIKSGGLDISAEASQEWVVNLRHPSARWAWVTACECQKLLTNTDPDDVLYLLDEVAHG